MASRPLIQKSAKELEALVRAADGNLPKLQEILSELSFRKTPSAVRLRETVAKKVSVALEEREVPVPTAKQTPRTTVRSDASGTASNIHSAPEKEASTSGVNVSKTLKPRPPITDQPEQILGAWTALEVLSPQGYRRESDLTPGNPNDIVALLPNGPMPWQLETKSRPGKKLLFEIVLGTLELGPAVASLLNVYSDKRPDPPSKAGTAILASIIVDKAGVPFEEETSLVISSFAWGVPVALRGDLTALGGWSSEEKNIRRDLHRQLYRRLPSGEIAPLDFPAIRRAHQFLVGRLDLQGQETREPHFAIRRYEFFASKLPVEPTCILNSFYLGDLDLARKLYAAGKAPNTLNRYLGQSVPPSRKNLLDDRDALREELAPHNTPPGRWPAPGGHPLAVLQQVAVNGTTGASERSTILAVNGPPGTGKTTLLRDIVAARIIERAEAMAKFDDPAKAFRATDQAVQRKGATLTFHRVDQTLRGHEMVVSSSNNKAVENVSAELPTMSAMGGLTGETRYFPSVADHVLEGSNWGMISAVLGNSGNRYQFSERFWRDEENGMSTYLNHAAGCPQIAHEKDSSGKIIQKIPRVITNESPPRGRMEALERWTVARRSFLSASEVVRRLLSERKSVHQALMEIPPAISAIADLQNQCVSAERVSQAAGQRRDQAAADFARANQSQEECSRSLASHRQRRPGFFIRLFNLQTARVWTQTFKSLTFSFDLECRVLAENKSRADQEFHHAIATARQFEELKTQLRASKDHLRQLQSHVNLAKISGICLPDDEHFSQPSLIRETASMWFSREEQGLREKLFTAAMNLHRAFIDAAADPIRQNLGIFMDTYGTRSFGTSMKDGLIEDLWATFFLIVPVVSTTFASMERMFSRVKPGAIGWLLVDEAGQATPQAAVGGLLRSRRAVVVGDPLQIEPVVMLPNTLTEEICGQFGISALKFNAPEASVQTLADAASPLCGRFPSGNGWREVGSPLLVHRRCDSPMFEISNSIAYANLMVSAKSSPASPPPLGASRWIDVQMGSTFDKWSEEEGREVIKLLRRLRAAGVPPDLYIVTPFVTVQDHLRREIGKSDILNGWSDSPNTWPSNNVGTVHTVQGREASTVIFVLGAPSASQQGARTWAGGSPNLLNVAVTRAKTALYVIGNRQLWAQAGVFRKLDDLIP